MISVHGSVIMKSFITRLVDSTLCRPSERCIAPVVRDGLPLQTSRVAGTVCADLFLYRRLVSVHRAVYRTRHTDRDVYPSAVSRHINITTL